MNTLQVSKAFSTKPWVGSFHVVVWPSTAKKCTKIYNARAGPLFFSFNPIVLWRSCSHRHRICLNSLMMRTTVRRLTYISNICVAYSLAFGALFICDFCPGGIWHWWWWVFLCIWWLQAAHMALCAQHTPSPPALDCWSVRLELGLSGSKNVEALQAFASFPKSFCHVTHATSSHMTSINLSLSWKRFREGIESL